MVRIHFPPGLSHKRTGWNAPRRRCRNECPPRAFAHQAVALAVRPLGVLFGNCRHARHAAMAPFATQPPQEPALQQLGVEPVGFRSAMLPRYRDTRCMDHVSLDATRRKPGLPARWRTAAVS